jgi:hypothetical protein
VEEEEISANQGVAEAADGNKFQLILGFGSERQNVHFG